MSTHSKIDYAKGFQKRKFGAEGGGIQSMAKFPSYIQMCDVQLVTSVTQRQIEARTNGMIPIPLVVLKTNQV